MQDKVRVFVSSPSDVPAERVAVERVAYRVAGQYDHVEIEVYRWEHGHYFSAHTGFQEQIAELGGFDLVVGILWSRIGSPLPADFPARMPAPREGEPYPSGTAFELLEAIELRRRRAAPPPDILVYRKTAPTPSAKADDDKMQRELTTEREAVNAFIRDFFANETAGFRAAFQSVGDLTELEARFEADLFAWLRENRSLGRPRKWRVEEKGSPFRGLDPFDAAHRDVFFGRRAEIERARERLAEGRGFLLVDGASGTGKSSLVRAGLLPRLRDLAPDLRVAVTRPDTAAPLTALAQALFDTEALPQLVDGDYPEAPALARHLLNGGDVSPILRALDRAGKALTDAERRDLPAQLRLVLVVDQLEALFVSRVPTEEQHAYGASLEALVGSGRVQVIATLRANAREAALGVPAIARLINANQGLSLGPPTPDAFGEIVRGPATAAGIAFERDADGIGLDEVLLREVERDPDALPLLQFALDRLFDLAASRVKAKGAALGDVPEGAPVLSLTHADYTELDGLSGAIGHQSEAALRGRSAAERARLAQFIRALTAAGSGGAVLGSAPVSVAAPDPETRELVASLVEARVLVQDVVRESGTDRTVEVLRFSHERVLSAWDRAREAVAAAAKYLRVRDDLVRMEVRWRTAGKPADLLLPAGLPLAEAEEILAEFGAELDLQAPALRAYVRASDQRARRRQRLAQASAAVFAMAALAAGWFAFESERNASEADRQREEAEASAIEAAENARIARENANRADMALAEANRAREDLAIAADNAFRTESRLLVEQARLSLLDDGPEADLRALRLALAALPADPVTEMPDRPVVAEAVQGLRDVVDAVETRRERRAAKAGAFLEATWLQVDLGPLQVGERVPFIFHSGSNMLALGKGTRLQVSRLNGESFVVSIPGTASIEDLLFVRRDAVLNRGEGVLVFLSDGSILSYELERGIATHDYRVIAPPTESTRLWRVSVSSSETRALVNGPVSAMIDYSSNSLVTELERDLQWHFTNGDKAIVGFTGPFDARIRFRSPADSGETLDEVLSVPFDLEGAFPGSNLERQFFWGNSYVSKSSAAHIYEIGYVPNRGLKVQRVLTGMNSEPVGSVYLPDEERLYVWSGGNRLLAWDLGKESNKLERPAILSVEVDVRKLRGVVFFDDHRTAVVWGDGEWITVVDTETGSQIGELTAPWGGLADGVELLRWAGPRPAHDQIVLASPDRIELWDVARSTLLAQMSGFEADAVDLALSHDGSYAATLHANGHFRVWALPNPGQPYVETTVAERRMEWLTTRYASRADLGSGALAERMRRANVLIDILDGESKAGEERIQRPTRPGFLD